MNQENYEKKIQKNNLFWLIGVIGALIIGLISGAVVIKGKYRKYDDPNIQKIVKTYELMQNEWYFGKDYENFDNMITESAINGMLDNGDPYTFYTGTEAEQGLTLSREGCGFSHVFYGGHRYITDVYANSPADKAGVKPADIIYGFYEGTNYVDLKSLGKDEGTARMSAHTNPSITFKGSFSRVEKEITIVKDEYITTPMVSQTIESNGTITALIDINTFVYQNLGYAVNNSLKNIIEEKGKIDKIVFDLRDNGGGYVQAAVDLASLFVPDHSLILTYEFRDGSRQNIYSSKIGNLPAFDDIVILQNHNTASASETFTVAMRDHLPDVVTTIGTVSYGKGIVQSFYKFEDGSVIRYTMAKSYSPDGYTIHGIGVSPDEEIAIDPNIFYTYYGDTEVLSPEMKTNIMHQINLVMSESYTDYLTALHAFQTDINSDISDTFTRGVAQVLQENVWDRYLLICEQTLQAGLNH